MANWLDRETLEECKRQIREGLAPRSRIMAEVVDRLVEQQLEIVPALALIVSSESPAGRECDIRHKMRDKLANEVARLRFDPALADLIIDIQMRLVPRILKSLDQILAEKGF